MITKFNCSCGANTPDAKYYDGSESEPPAGPKNLHFKIFIHNSHKFYVHSN